MVRPNKESVAMQRAAPVVQVHSQLGRNRLDVVVALFTVLCWGLGILRYQKLALCRNGSSVHNYQPIPTLELACEGTLDENVAPGRLWGHLVQQPLRTYLAFIDLPWLEKWMLGCLLSKVCWLASNIFLPSSWYDKHRTPIMMCVRFSCKAFAFLALLLAPPPVPHISYYTIYAPLDAIIISWYSLTWRVGVWMIMFACA